VAAYAPLHSQGRPLGLLGLSSGPAADDAPTDAVAQGLSAAIDFAAVSAALLGPGLRQRFELHTSQAELRRVLDGDGFTPVFQPVIDLARGAIVGYETLTRFADGAAPQRRFAEAARVGMGHAFERATMAAALTAAAALRDVWISVNVSPGFLAAGGVEGLPRSATCSLVLELTEHDPVDDYAEIRRAIQRLDGVRLSIDDAGAGYACLTHVLTLGPAFVKLDRGWVVGIDADPARQALVAGLQSFAERTGATIIAEGIETEAELATLRELGVALGQGYLLGRPRPATALVASG
ncbi:MAG: EAL domain-containing protein, partial [Actinomycetota bacterium]|nr:EAL domain-containing protein [Actinomycetota bacterium]